MKLIRKGTQPVMKLHDEKMVPYVTFPLLDELEGYVHGFSTRLGGVSEGDFASLNLSFTRGDDPEHVRENYRRIADSMGFLPENMVLSQQTHTTHIYKVTEKERGMGFTKPLEYTDIDGLMTNVPGLVLVTSYADCVPLYFVDPVKKQWL